MIMILTRSVKNLAFKAGLQKNTLSSGYRPTTLIL